MHGMRLYEMRDLSRLPADQADAVRAFLQEHRQLQARLHESLGADDSQVQRASDLIWTWDFLSLALCLDWAPSTAKSVPSTDGPVPIALEPAADRSVTCDPWPFAGQQLTVHAEGRRLDAEGYATASELRNALDTARWETIVFELRSA
jgi:Protein of unknown function (DUF3891)